MGEDIICLVWLAVQLGIAFYTILFTEPDIVAAWREGLFYNEDEDDES